MAKKNYSKMYVAEGETVEVPVADTTEEKPVRKKKPKMVKGTVVGCARLNVREQMNTHSTVLCVIPASAEVKVFTEENHPEWEHVITADGIEGFCMKKYIQL